MPKGGGGGQLPDCRNPGLSRERATGGISIPVSVKRVTFYSTSHRDIFVKIPLYVLPVASHTSLSWSGSRAGGVSDKLSLTLQALVLIGPRGFAWEA